MKHLSTLVLCLLFLSVPAVKNISAFEIDEGAFETLQRNMLEMQKSLESMRSSLESQNELIRQQAGKIEALERGRGMALQPVPGEMPLGTPKTAGISQGFNPDIGLVGTVQTKLTQDSTDAEGNDTIALKELELNFAHVVDPYSRADAVISFNDELEEQSIEIEEGYYTRWGLPLGFATQLGKFRSKIGKQNLLHLDQLPTANYPLVIRDFFGEEGLSSSGIRLQNNIPNPWDIPIEITGEILCGNNGTSFSGISRRPIFNTHSKTYLDLSKDANVELGWTTLFGDENAPVTELDGDGNEVRVIRPQGSDHYGARVFGADATMNWFLSEGKRLKWQNEVYFQNRTTSLVHVNDDPWGFYTLLDYKFSPRFSAGVRFDFLQPLDVTQQHKQTTEISPYLVFWQSEFADMKIQYSHTDPANADAKGDNAVYLTVDFLIGAHQHPVQ